jgi:hypothetical protein
MAPIATLALHISNVIPTKMAAIPVVAGLLVGAAAGASFMVGSSSADTREISKPAIASAAPAELAPPLAPPAAPASPSRVEQPCDAQTWPYIEAKCMSSADQKRKVRVVAVPRANETPTEAQLSSDAARAANPGLVSGNTVLYQPQKVAPEAKPRGKRETRRQRERRVMQAYEVPSEFGRGGRAVIVVRPLPLEAFR